MYTGCTGNTIKCIAQHRQGTARKLTKKYNAHQLIYFEEIGCKEKAFSGERQSKAGSRTKKIDLFLKRNPDGDDLHKTILKK